MTKFRFVAISLALFIPWPAMSAKRPVNPRELAWATLSFRTNLGYNGVSTLLITTDHKVLIDGQELNAVQVSLSAPHLTRLLELGTATGFESCGAGSFMHAIRIRGKASVEQGCLDTRAFGELNASFAALRGQFPN